MKNRLFFALALTSMLTAIPLGAQAKQPAQTAAASAAVSEKPRLAVFGFLNLTEDDSFSIPAETASNNLFITMRMLNLFQTMEQDTVPRNLTDSGLEQWCARNNVDFVIFGTMKLRDDGGQDYRLAYFSRAAKRITASKKESGENVLDVFSVVDSLTDSMLGTIVDNKISFGSLAFANTGIEGDYDIYLDGSFIQTNPSKFDRVPAGDHTVRVVQKATGIELVNKTVTVAAKKQDKIEFALKEPTKAELASATAAPRTEQEITDAEIAENISAIKIAIKAGPGKNFEEIFNRAKIVPEADRIALFEANKKTVAGPFLANLFVSPLIPVGSVMQGDVNGVVMATGLKVIGISLATWFVVTVGENGGKDPGPFGAVFLAGIGTFVVANIYSYSQPFAYANAYNTELQGALGLRKDYRLSPSFGFAPVGDTIVVRVGLRVDM
jgi:TolB-like protein